jgi:hypothetical protein
LLGANEHKIPEGFLIQALGFNIQLTLVCEISGFDSIKSEIFLIHVFGT